MDHGFPKLIYAFADQRLVCSVQPRRKAIVVQIGYKTQKSEITRKPNALQPAEHRP